MDFGAYPPEINSGRMYTGPGPGPMLAAAEAWDGLASELSIAAAGYGSAISELTSGLWLGPTSLSMVAAVAPYVSWLSTTAGQAEETANQARAAVAAYEAAFAMTVPPPVIAANRVLLMTLIATNFFGQNTPAIMAAEAHYMEMWAQDAAAMYGYAGASATAAQVPPFNDPPPTTGPAALTGQAAAVTKAALTPAGPSAQTTAATSTSLASGATVPQVLQQLASSSASTSPLSSLRSWIGSGGWLGTGITNANLNSLRRVFQAYFATGVTNFFTGISNNLIVGQGAPAGGGAAGGTSLSPAPGLGGLGGGGAVSARAGEAGSIGRMSVPPSWAAASGPGASPTAQAATLSSVTSATEGRNGPGGLLRGIPMNGTGRRATPFVHKYGFRHAVMPRPPAAG